MTDTANAPLSADNGIVGPMKYETQMRAAITARLKHEISGNGLMYRLIGYGALMVAENGKRARDRIANMLDTTLDGEGLADSTKRCIANTAPVLAKLASDDGGHIPAFPATFTNADVEAWVIAARDFAGVKRANEMAAAIPLKLRTLAAPALAAEEKEAAAAIEAVAPHASKLQIVPPATAPAPDFALMAANVLSAAVVLPPEMRRDLVTRLLSTFDPATLAGIARDIVSLIAPQSQEQVAA